jgi:K+-transporting ATPase ATPase C chain
MVWLFLDRCLHGLRDTSSNIWHSKLLEALDISGIHLVVLPVRNRILPNMIRMLRTALTIFGLFAFILGIAYPLVVTGIAQVVFPGKANGSIIYRSGVSVGSVLIGQEFTGPEYFWGRPSVTSNSPYTPFDPMRLTGSSGSNLGPLSKLLVTTVQERIIALQAADPGNQSPIPVDLLTSSASGLDPHISVEAAYYQVARIARTRGLDHEVVTSIVEQNIESRWLGILGEPRVNVLVLNLALDGIK